MRRQNQERIEPSTSLVNTLGNKVGGESAFERFLILKRIVLLRIGHANVSHITSREEDWKTKNEWWISIRSALCLVRSDSRSPPRLKPTVKHLFYSSQDALAFLWRNGDLVDFIAVEVVDAFNTRKGFQLLDGAYANNLK